MTQKPHKKLPNAQHACLLALRQCAKDGLAMPLDAIAAETGLSRDEVRGAMRGLRRKKLADYHKGLTDAEGTYVGIGYVANAAGRAWVNPDPQLAVVHVLNRFTIQP